MTDSCEKCGGWLAVETIHADYGVGLEVRCVNCGWYRLHPPLHRGADRQEVKRGAYK